MVGRSPSGDWAPCASFAVAEARLRDTDCLWDHGDTACTGEIDELVASVDGKAGTVQNAGVGVDVGKFTEDALFVWPEIEELLQVGVTGANCNNDFLCAEGLRAAGPLDNGLDTILASGKALDVTLEEDVLASA
ncbi:hypothetical protein IAQ61_005351 [Plenodomus lingam]|uniref:uncharacterized protein n=1 Tax=Leptosphaeria maculans TaxID=5022 RepID=UPI003323BCFE|nr:hypothetical protein IAQ61_005351 [Plenodomus lingam]